MRVIHFIPSISEGGAPLGVLELARRQAELGADIGVVVLDEQTSPVAEQFSSMSIAFLNQHYQFGDHRSINNCVESLQGYLRKHNPDILHAHLWPATFISAKARTSGSSARVVSHIRDTPAWLNSFAPRNLLKRFWFRIALNGAKVRFIAVSQEANWFARKGLGIHAGRIATVINAIDPRRFAKTATRRDFSTFSIGIIGRLAPEKGHIDFLRAMRMLRATSPLAVTIVGTGSQRSRLVEFVKANELGQQVRFIDSVDDMGDFLQKQDLLVMPSRGAEGLPRVVMEAMWCGTPVLATDTSGVTDIIKHDDDGIVVRNGDLKGMAREIDRLIAFPDKRRAIGECGKQRARQLFVLDRMISEVNAQYELAIQL